MSSMKRGALDVGAMLDWLEVPSRQRGPERWACCPIHGEREPSFQIRDDGTDEAGLWRCFGCGEHGNAQQLVALLLDVTLHDAREMMVERGFYGAPPPIPVDVQVTHTEHRPSAGFRMPPGVVFGDPAGWTTPAREFIARRGITAAQVARWRIGAGTRGKLTGRLVVPVYDGNAVLRGYTARTFVDADKRYDEPSAEDGYAPGFVWGELWWPEPEQRGVVVVCEGALNGLAVERLLPRVVDTGPLPAVAALRGSQLHPGHVMRLSTFPIIVALTDPDAAGEKAYRAMCSSFGRWSKLRRCMIEGGDANDLERQDPGRLCEALSMAMFG